MDERPLNPVHPSRRRAAPSADEPKRRVPSFPRKRESRFRPPSHLCLDARVRGHDGCRRRAVSKRRRAESGHALAATLLIIAALMPLGAFAVMHARMDLLLQRHAREALELFYVAESGLDHALADLGLEPWFDRLLAGPDRVGGTADDGEFPFRHAPPGFFPRAPLRYEVRVEPLGPDAAEVIARSRGAGRATRAVAASIVRSAAPFVPAAVFSGGDPITFALGGDFRISGIDRGQHDAPHPALAVVSEATVHELAGGLSNDAAARLRGAGGSPSIVVGGFPPVEKQAAAFAGDARARRVGPAVAGALGSGILLSRGSLDVGAAEGAGVLVVEGDLRVHGRFAFEGLVLALGDVVFDRDSDARIAGSLLHGGGPGRLHFLGTGEIAFDSRVIERIEAEFPRLLPRRAAVTGWRELL